MTKDGGDRRMTRKQVHDLMENELRCVQRGNYCDRECAKCPLVKDDKELIEAYGYVIKELEQEPREDTISRKDTLKAMIEQLGIRNEDYLIPAEATLYKIVKNMPPVTPHPKMGRWISVSERLPEDE